MLQGLPESRVLGNEGWTPETKRDPQKVCTAFKCLQCQCGPLHCRHQQLWLLPSG